MTDYKNISTLLSSSKKIVITTHTSPDGDAIGSSLGLYHYLIQKNHQVTVIVPNAYPEFLHWLPGHKSVLNYEKNKKKSADALNKAEIIFCLDFNDLKRIEELGNLVSKTKAVKIMIDHHPQPADFAKHIISDTAASSTAQLIYEFVEKLGNKKLLNKNMAECLYAGIMTDSGSFRFSSTSPQTHIIAAELLKTGIKPDEIYGHIFDSNSTNRLKLLGFALNEKLNVIDKYKAAYIALSKDELQRYSFKKGDTEGFVNYALSVKGVKLAVLFLETDGVIKLSFRSKGNFSVNDLARKHFNGGGHVNAAGGRLENITLDDTVSMFLAILPEFEKQLCR